MRHSARSSEYEEKCTGARRSHAIGSTVRSGGSREACARCSASDRPSSHPRASAKQCSRSEEDIGISRFQRGEHEQRTRRETEHFFRPRRRANGASPSMRKTPTRKHLALPSSSLRVPELMMAARFTVVRRAIILSGWLAALALLATPVRSQEPVVFGVIGDTGEVSKGLLNVVREMSDYHRERARFDFVLLLGDNIYRDGVGRGIHKVFEVPFAHLLAAGVEFYAVLGNHDIRRGTKLQVNYPGWNMNGRRFYSFSKGDRTRRVLRARFDGPRRRGERARRRREGQARPGARRPRAQGDAHRLGDAAARTYQRRARRGRRVRQGAGNREERTARLAAGRADTIEGAMEGGVPASLHLLGGNQARWARWSEIRVDPASAARAHLRRWPGRSCPCRPRSPLRPVDAATREPVQRAPRRVCDGWRERAPESRCRRRSQHIHGQGRGNDPLVPDRAGDPRCHPHRSDRR